MGYEEFIAAFVAEGGNPETCFLYRAGPEDAIDFLIREFSEAMRSALPGARYRPVLGDAAISPLEPL